MKKAFAITFGLANAGLLLYGVLALFRPAILLSGFQADVYTFAPGEAQAVVYIAGLFRLLGSFNAAIGLVGLFLLGQWLRSQSAWIIRLLMLSTFLAYLGPVIFDNTVGRIGPFEVVEHILFFGILAISGLYLLGIGRWNGS